MPDTLCNFSLFWLSLNIVIRGSSNANAGFFFHSEVKQEDQWTPLCLKGCCYTSDPVERTSVYSLQNISSCSCLSKAAFMALEGARRTLRRQNSGEWLHSRASNQEGTIFITVHGVKGGGKKKQKHFRPFSGDCWAAQHLVVCMHKNRAINALLILTVNPFQTGSPNEYKEYWFLNPCRFSETMQTDLIIINKIYRQWCNPAEIFLPKSMA